MFDYNRAERAVQSNAAMRADAERWAGIEAANAPLSGEWADTPTPVAMLRACDIDPDALNDIEYYSLLDAYEAAYWDTHARGESARQAYAA